MAKVCKHCKYRNNDSASFCVRCGKTLSGTIAKVFVPQNEYELLKRKNLALEEKVKSLESLDALRLEEIKRLQESNKKSNVTEQSMEYYDVFLTNAGFAKLQVLKTIKESLGIGLKEAKDYVDGIPSILGTGISKSKAESLKLEIEAAGGAIEIRQHIDVSLGYLLIKKSEYDDLISVKKKFLKTDHTPLEIKINKDEQDSDLWIKKMRSLLNINKPEIEVTIKQSEYDNLRKRASKSLWEKFKETLGL